MYKIDIGLGFSVIKDAFESYNRGILDNEIGQHRVILSKKIVDYYESSAKECSLLAPIMGYIQSIGGTNKKAVIYKSDEGDLDPKEEIISFVMKTPLKVLISDKTEFAENDIKRIDITTREDIEIKDFNHQFNWYVFPLTKTAEENEECNNYIKWLSCLFLNEQTITIVDPYLLGKDNLRYFIETILPIIPIETEIIIFSDIEHSRSVFIDRNTNEKKNVDYHTEAERIINDLKVRGNRKITINWCSGKMHDRFIVLSNCEINLSNSLIALQKDKCFRNSCQFNVTKEKRSLPITIEQREKEAEFNKSVQLSNHTNEGIDYSILGSELSMIVSEVSVYGEAKGTISDKFNAVIPKSYLKHTDPQLLIGKEIQVIVKSINNKTCIVQPKI